MTQINLSMKHKQTHGEQTCGGGIEGFYEEFGIVDANHYIQNGLTTRSCCIEQGTIFSIL